MGGDIPACAMCNIDPVNAVREKMFELERGDIAPAELEEMLKIQQTINDSRLPQDIDILQWQDSIPQI